MDLEKFKSILQKNGYKITKQREVIFETLLENASEHLSPEELHLIVNKKDFTLEDELSKKLFELEDKATTLYNIISGETKSEYEYFPVVRK